VLDGAEETFDEVALAIELEEAVAIMAFVGEEGCGLDFLDQDLGLRYVVNVSAGEAHRQWIAQHIETMA